MSQINPYGPDSGSDGFDFSDIRKHLPKSPPPSQGSYEYPNYSQPYYNFKVPADVQARLNSLPPIQPLRESTPPIQPLRKSTAPTQSLRRSTPPIQPLRGSTPPAPRGSSSNSRSQSVQASEAPQTHEQRKAAAKQRQDLEARRLARKAKRNEDHNKWTKKKREIRKDGGEEAWKRHKEETAAKLQAQRQERAQAKAQKEAEEKAAKAEARAAREQFQKQQRAEFAQKCPELARDNEAARLRMKRLRKLQQQGKVEEFRAGLVQKREDYWKDELASGDPKAKQKYNTAKREREKRAARREEKEKEKKNKKKKIP